MGYIEKNLMDGEQIVYEARQHWMIYWKPFLLLLIGIGLFAIPTSDMALVMQICMSLVLLVVAGIWAVNIYGGRKYILTNRRLILKRGLVRRESTDLVLRRCEGVSIAQSIMGRLLGYGTVSVSTGEVANEFRLIEHPVEFATHINQQIADAVGKAPVDIV
ncbi:MAG: PH domain-containing protein [Prevotella sp.]|nr:PH domain-containing protein [Prevotella sp.]